MIRCHGEKGNVVYEMAKDKNLLVHSTKEIGDDQLIRSNGEIIPMELSKKLTTLTFDIYGGEHYDEERINYDGSFGNFCTEK